ncbi:MAG TPA: beta-propeller fold lactonase family protein [Terriglobales bacterium]
MRTSSRWVLILVVLLAMALGSCANARNNLGNGNVWVATQGDQKLTSFSINLTTGALSSVGNPVATGATPAGMVMTPDQKTIFLANSGDNSITAYSINSDGSLKAVSGSTSTLIQGPSGCASNCTLGQMPAALAIDPGGKFLFVADQGQPSNPMIPGGVSVFSISGTSLSPAGPGCPSGFTQTACPILLTDPTTGFSTGPSGIAISPVSFSCGSTGSETCNALYVANQFSNTVSGFQYFVDSSGAFHVLPTGGSPYTAGTNPTGLAFSRCAGVSSANAHCTTNDGNNLFVTNSGSGNLMIFTACIQAVGSCAVADGSLLASPGTATTGIGPIAVVANPLINFVYTVDRGSNQVSQFSYSPITAVLSALSPAAVSTAQNPMSAGITGNGRILIVSNNATSNMSVYTITQPPSSGGSSTATGKLVPAGQPTVSLSGQPSAVLVR